MTEKDPADIDRFAAKLDAAKAEMLEKPAERPDRSETGLGVGMRLGIELGAGLLVGFGFGWLIDNWLGTRPWFMLALMLLGLAGGMRNVMRMGKALMADEDESGKTGR